MMLRKYHVDSCMDMFASDFMYVAMQTSCWNHEVREVCKLMRVNFCLITFAPRKLWLCWGETRLGLAAKNYSTWHCIAFAQNNWRTVADHANNKTNVAGTARALPCFDWVNPCLSWSPLLRLRFAFGQKIAMLWTCLRFLSNEFDSSGMFPVFVILQYACDSYAWSVV